MLDLTALQRKAPAEASAWIHDTDASRFEQDVLGVSLKTPVIVDFWAPWCGPCKQMMPALEKVVNEAEGAVRLVKVDIDKNPELAQVFRVQSVPMVYAFFQGQPVDGFMGAKPESELRAFVEKLKKLAGVKEEKHAADIAATLASAEGFFREEKYDDAIAAYSTALDAAPDNMDAMAGLGWCLIAQREMEGVRDILSQLTDEQKNHPRIKGLSFLVSQDTAGIESAEALAARLEKNPKDHAARFDLARQNLAVADIAGAIDALVELTRRDREWQDQKARKLLLEILEALGPAHPLASAGRRRLSAILFS